MIYVHKYCFLRSIAIDFIFKEYCNAKKVIESQNLVIFSNTSDKCSQTFANHHLRVAIRWLLWPSFCSLKLASLYNIKLPLNNNSHKLWVPRVFVVHRFNCACDHKTEVIEKDFNVIFVWSLSAQVPIQLKLQIHIVLQIQLLQGELKKHFIMHISPFVQSTRAKLCINDEVYDMSFWIINQ